MAGEPEASVPTVPPSERIERHAAVDRAFHWITALCVLVLLATGLLPVVGVEFPWVTIHWVSGIIVIVAVLFHVVRAVFWQCPRALKIGGREVDQVFGNSKPGKYTIAQKLMHHALALVVLTAVVTGVLMMAKIDTPFWERNPYLLSAGTWGIIYVLHGLAALTAVPLVMIHVYFGWLPENRMYLHAMRHGWALRAEFLRHHDPQRWRALRR